MNYRLIAPVCATLVGLIVGAVSGTFQTDKTMREPGSALMSPMAAKQQTPSMGDARVEALNNALSIAGGTMDLRQLARLHEALTLVDSEQIPALLDRLESNGSDDRRDRLMWFFRWWHQRDPARATAWIRKRLVSLAQDGPLGSTFFATSRNQLIEAWAKTNPKDALQFAREYPRSGVAASLLGYAVEAWAEQSGPARMALVLEFPAGNARERVLKTVLAKWGEKDPSSALAAAQALADSSERKKAVTAVLQAWGEKDPEGAFAKYLDLGTSDIGLATRLLRSVAGKNPTRAVELLAQIDPAQISEVAPEIVLRWAERDPVAAFNWALESGVGFNPHSERSFEAVHNFFGRNIITKIRSFDPLSTALQKQQKAVLDWIGQLPAGAERDRLTERALEGLGDLDQSLLLFARLPPDAAARSVRNVARLFSSKPERVQDALKWAESLPEGEIRANAWETFGKSPVNIPLPPAGPERDAMLSGKILRNGTVASPIAPIEMAMQISDPVLRQDMVNEVMERYAKYSPEWAQKALDWLEKSDVPEEWKQRWRSQIPAK